MNARQTISKLCRTPALLVLVLPLAAGSAAAATYDLVAAPFAKAMPDGTSVTMWGYGPAGSPSVPGPALVVPAGDTSLTVNLTNNLPVATSIVISGQAMPTDGLGAALAPVKFTDGSGRQRVSSFTAEVPAGAGQSYTWNNLKPGTYLYHSGTHPQVQVQMGLYGPMTNDAVAAVPGTSPAEAYAGVPYNSEVTLVFSEVDPVLHDAVANGRYGEPVPDPLPPGLTAADYPSSTLDYAPKYFLINGQDLSDPSLALAAGSAGQTTLLRLLNAGLQSRSPVLQGHYMRLIAEDGNLYPHARAQYSTFLPALKTVDAVITPTAATTDPYPLYDRRLATVNPGATGSTEGGMLAYLTVAGAAPGTPLASNDAYATDEDTPLSVAAPGVLGNDGAYADDATTTANWLSSPSHGAFVPLADGSFTYTPAANYSGADSFTYQAVNSSGQSLPATVSLTVNAVNDAPVAAADAYSVAAGTTLNVTGPGVLGNDTDVDGDTITAVNHSALAGLTPSADGGFSYAATTAGEVNFTYQASDGIVTSDPATVTITVTAAPANAPPVAANDTVSAPRRTTANSATYTPVNVDVLANDSDPDGNLGTNVQIVVDPNKGGLVSVNADGSVSYTPALNFRGTENFSYTVTDTAGATSNIARVRVNVK